MEVSKKNLWIGDMEESLQGSDREKMVKPSWEGSEKAVLAG